MSTQAIQGTLLRLSDQVEKLRGRFGLSRMVLVETGECLTQTKIDVIRGYPGIGWIFSTQEYCGTGICRERSPSVYRSFDARNLAEISSPEYPANGL